MMELKSLKLLVIYFPFTKSYTNLNFLSLSKYNSKSKMILPD